MTERLIRQKGDMVSQREVAHGAQVAERTVSEQLGALMLQGLVDIGPDAWGFSYRILVTKQGAQLVAQLRRELLDVAAALPEAPPTKGLR